MTTITKRGRNGIHTILLGGVNIGEAWKRPHVPTGFGLRVHGVRWRPSDNQPQTCGGWTTTSTKTLKEAVKLAVQTWGQLGMGVKHGGKREGAGRKAADGATLDTSYLLKLETGQKSKLLALGGASFLRAAIDEARDPREPLSGLMKSWVSPLAYQALNTIKVAKTPPRVSKSPKG